jgi:hypothetical protein
VIAMVIILMKNGLGQATLCRHLSFFLFGVWTQGLMLIWQVLYCLSHSASPYICIQNLIVVSWGWAKVSKYVDYHNYQEKL